MRDRGELIARLRAACAAHDARAKEPWSGPYHFARENDAIEAIRAEVDDLLMRSGQWPENTTAIGNDRAIALLSAGDAQ